MMELTVKRQFECSVTSVLYCCFFYHMMLCACVRACLRFEQAAV